MACEINNIQDPTLKYLVSIQGEGGIKTYLNLTASVISNYETAGSVSKNSARELMHSLDNYNSQNAEHHYYKINGVVANEKIINSIKNDSVVMDLNIDFGTKYTNQSYKYAPDTNKQPEDQSEQDGEDQAVESIESPGGFEVDSNGIMDTDVYDEIDDVDNFDIDDDWVSYNEDDLDIESDFEDIKNNALEYDFDISEAMSDEMFEEQFADMPFSTSPFKVHLSLGMKIVGRKIKASLDDMRTMMSRLEKEIERTENEINEAGPSEKNTRRIVELMDKLRGHQKNLHTIKTSMYTLWRKSTLKSLSALYDRHAEWVNSVLRSKNPTPAELNSVAKAIEMWQNIKSKFKRSMRIDKKTLDGIFEIQNKAFNAEFDLLYTKILPSFIVTTGKDMFGLVIPENSLFNESDISSVGSRTLSLDVHTDKPILHLLHKILSAASYRSTNELFDTSKKISDIFDALKKDGLDYKSIFSRDENGKWDGNILARLTKSYYNFRAKLDADFEEKMNTIRYSRADNADALMLLEVKKRSADIRKNIYTINPELLNTGNGRAEVKNQLMSIVNDEKYVNSLIEEADRKYNNWKELYDHMIESEAEAVKNGKNIDESGAYLSEFKNNTSPSEYYNYVYKNGGTVKDIRMFNDIGKYIVESPLSVDAQGKSLNNYDNRFVQNVLSNDKMLKFYNSYMELLARNLALLPQYATKDIDGTFVANVKKDMANSLLKNGLRGIPVSMHSMLMDSITSRNGMQLEYLDVDGNPRNSIPLRYLKDIDIEDKSDNLERNLIEFATMAIAYKHLAMIEDTVLLIKDVVGKNIEEIPLRADGLPDTANIGKTNPNKAKLPNINRLIKHTLDNILYNKGTDKEGTMPHKRFDPNRKIISVIDPGNAVTILKEFNEIAMKSGVDIASSRILKKYNNAVVYESEKVAGQKLKKMIGDLEFDHDDGKVTDSVYNHKIDIYRRFSDHIGANYIWSEIGNVSITFGAYKVFSYNPFPAAANIGFGYIQIMSHAAGRTEFTPSEAIAGIIHASKSLLNTVSRSGRIDNVLYAISMRYSVLPEHYGGDANATDFNVSFFAPLGMLSQGDYILRLAVLDAMMHNTKIKDKNGVERSLIEAFKGDGTWNVEKFGENSEWGADSSSLIGNEKMFEFINKVKFVNKMLHGNMAKESAIELKRYAVGRLLSQYRMSWLADSVYSRIAPRNKLGVLGRDFEGTYRTIYNFVGQEGLFPAAAQLTKVFAKLLLFRGESAFDGIKIKQSDKALFMANIRKQLYELKTMLLLLSAYLFVSASLDEEDKEQKRWKYLMLNISNKILQDITFYINPASFKTTTDNLVPAFGLLLDAQKFGNAMTQHLLGNEYYNTEVVKERAAKVFPLTNVYYKVTDRMEGVIQNK